MVSLVVVKKNLDGNVSEVVPIHPLTIEQLIEQLKEKNSSTQRFQCSNDELNEISPFLSNNSDLETIYILTDQKDLLWPADIDREHSKWIEVNDEKQLKRYLYSKAMLYYYKKGLEFKEADDFFQSNLCFDKVHETRKKIQLTC